MKTISILCFFCLTLTLYGQESDRKHFFQMGLCFSYNPNISAGQLLRTESDVIITGEKYYTGEVFGSYSLGSHLRIESGIGFTQSEIRVEDPWIKNSEYNETVPYMYLPVRFRYDFLKYFYCKGGITFGFDFSDSGEFNNQSGIGLNIGTGFKYEFKNRLSVYAGPYASLYSYITYDHGPFNPDVMLESSLLVGIMYRFK
jgi:hypothetical protein